MRDAGRIAEVLTPETLQLPRKLELLTNDLRSLEAIRDKKSGIKTFEFNSKRYDQRQADEIHKQLQQEKDYATNALAYADKRIYALAYHAADQHGQANVWKEKFNAWLTHEKKSTETITYYSDLMNIVQPAYQGQITIDQAHSIDNQLQLNEKKGKAWIQELLQQADGLPINADEKEALTKYAASNFSYFNASTGFNNDNLDLCLRAMGLLQYVHGQQSARAKKEYLEWQAGLLQSN